MVQVRPEARGDGAGEFVPGALATVGDVVGAGGAAIEQRERGLGQVLGAGGPSALIVHDFQGGPIARELGHGAYEVARPGRVKPARAHEQVLGTAAANGLFTRGLGAAIGAKRLQGRVHRVRLLGIAREHVVGAEVNQRNARALACLGQHSRRGCVSTHGRLLVLLGAVDVGVGGAIDESAPRLAKNRRDLGRLAGVEVGQIESLVGAGGAVEELAKGAAKHAAIANE